MAQNPLNTPTNTHPTIPHNGWARRFAPMLVLVGACFALCLLALLYKLITDSNSGSSRPPSAQSISVNASSPSVVKTNTAPRLTPTIRATTNASEAGRSTFAEQEIRDTLAGWTAAARDHDLEAQLRYYAEKVDVYYRYRNVGVDEVRASRVRAYERYSSLEIQLSNVEVTVETTGTSATATFDKTWNFSGQNSSDGSVQQKLWLIRSGTQWLISGEKDLKVYHVNYGK